MWSGIIGFIVECLAVISFPVYCLCVLLLLGIVWLFDWNYVDASVYVCEYGQPVITILFAFAMFVICCKHIRKPWKTQRYAIGTTLIVISLIHLLVILLCSCQLLDRINTYQGMTNSEIFNLVVQKLNMSGMPFNEHFDPTRDAFGLTPGYMIMNFLVYVLSITVSFLCSIVQAVLVRWIKKQIKVQTISASMDRAVKG